MSERTLLRIGALSAIIGAILAVVVNALYPRVPDPLDTSALLGKAATSTLWIGVHVGILASFLLFIGGLVALYRSIAGQPGAALARLGFAAAVVSGGVFLTWIGTNGYALRGAAEAWNTASAGDKALTFQIAKAVVQLNFGLFSVWCITYFGATFILYGLAVALSDAFPKWLGWLAILGGVGETVVGIVQLYNGPSVLMTNLLFPVFAVLITVWVFIMGILMWRKASAPA